ncbi:hypothetical protein LIER_12977 [Lithospermum erythrorhizon]|uniref:Uncharacterized protein n=1 Tax=Lithospermum erythrorhizon TaxID=34254 RepID=A0AAV3PTS8_LITER
MGRVKSLFRRRKGSRQTEQSVAVVVEVSSVGISGGGGGGLMSKVVKKKAAGSRLWMRFDRMGQSELMECDKSVIIKRVSIPARDLRILGPIFSHSSSILGKLIKSFMIFIKNGEVLIVLISFKVDVFGLDYKL